MNLETKDTVITIQHKFIQECSSKGFCPNHPNKYLNLNGEESIHQEEDTSCSTLIESDFHVQEVVEPETKHVEKVVLTAFDSIRPCPESFILQGDNRLSNEFILIPENNSRPEDSKVDLECLSLTFGFLLFISVKYAVNSASSWSSLFSEIKTIVNL